MHKLEALGLGAALAMTLMGCKARTDAAQVLQTPAGGAAAAGQRYYRDLAEACGAGETASRAALQQAGFAAGDISVFNGPAPIVALLATNDQGSVLWALDTQPRTNWWSGGAEMLPEGRLGTDLVSAGVGALYNQHFVDQLQALISSGALAAAQRAATQGPLHIVGNGAGGAMAQLMGYVLQRQFVNVASIHSVNAPTFVNAAGAARFKQGISKQLNAGKPDDAFGKLAASANANESTARGLLAQAGYGGNATRYLGNPVRAKLTQVIVAQDDGSAVVCFHDTQAAADVSTQTSQAAQNLVEAAPPAGRLGTDLVAAGVGSRFNAAILAQLVQLHDMPVLDELKQLQQRDITLHFVGQGRGGALAQLFGWVARRQFLKVDSIDSIDAPPFANDVFMTALRRDFGDALRP